jgi:hypothetical protein
MIMNAKLSLHHSEMSEEGIQELVFAGAIKSAV